MEEFMGQIEVALDNGQFYLALFCCLTLPDICGAISSNDGLSSATKYKAWFDRYVSPKYDGNLNGSNCYAFRCAALHQGRSTNRNIRYKRILFVDPASAEIKMHNNVLDDVLNIDTHDFCKDIIEGVRHWIKDYAGNKAFITNYPTFLSRYKGGFPPYISGVDVFS
jgi:hypothetical protein